MKNLVKNLAITLVITLAIPVQLSHAAFSDLSYSQQNYIAINFLQEENIINGYPDGTFRPDNYVNRAEFLAIALTGANIEFDVMEKTPFPDVDHDAWYAPALKKAYKEGWIDGYSDGKFKPEKGINKAEALKILGEIQEWEAKSSETRLYSDVPMDSWYASYVLYAKSNNFLEEVGDFYYPASPMTRANVSEVVYRTIAKERGIVVENISREMDVLLDIPFAAQAPFGEWNDIRQSEGCEEAAILMAVRWAKGQSLTLEEAKEEIIRIYEYQIANFWTAHDTSAQDTLDWIVSGYFNYPNVKLVENITIQDIKNELYSGNAVVVPVNGKLLPNPYFSGIGPLQHTILIKGYDSKTKEFITNDPGTRFGENFRYHSSVLDMALHDYESGDKTYLPEQQKTMLVVKPWNVVAYGYTGL